MNHWHSQQSHIIQKQQHFEGLIQTVTVTSDRKKGAILAHKAPKLHIFCVTDLQHTTTVH